MKLWFQLMVVLSLFGAGLILSGCQQRSKEGTAPQPTQPALVAPQVAPGETETSTPAATQGTDAAQPGTESAASQKTPSAGEGMASAEQAEDAEEDDEPVRLGRMIGGLFEAARSAVPVVPGVGGTKSAEPTGEAPPFNPNHQ